MYASSGTVLSESGVSLVFKKNIYIYIAQTLWQPQKDIKKKFN